MIHISRFVQPPNPNSAVPPSPSDRQPPHAARNGGGSRIPAHCRSRGGAVRKSAVRCGPKAIVPDRPATPNRLATRALPRRSPRYGLPENSPPPEKDGAAHTGPLRDELPETGHCSKRGPRKTNSSRGELHRTAAPEKRGFPKTNAQDEAFPKRASIPNRLRDEALRDGAIRPHAAIRGSVLPALPSRYAAGKPQPALRPCENALRTACRPKAARELRPNGVGARKVRPPLSRPRRPDGRR